MPIGRDNKKGKNESATTSEVNPSSESRKLAGVRNEAQNATDKARKPTQG